MDKKLAGMRPERLPAWRKLEKLAREPFDLTKPGALAPKRVAAMRASAAGFDLLYATERVSPEVVKTLGELARQTKAVEQFVMMMSGEVMNEIVGHESEGRRVLHTATRHLADGPRPKPAKEEADAVEAASEELARLKVFLHEIETGALTNAMGRTFTDLVQVGIGGSDLGPRALYTALRGFWKTGRRVHFISNVDPDDAASVAAGLDLSRTIINVVSKSGDTQETVANDAILRAWFQAAGLKPRDHFICVTGKGSKIDDETRYFRRFYIWDYIGGRYSATSMVGGVALGFGLGVENFIELLRGAREMDLVALNRDLRKNLPLLAALLGIWNRTFLGYETLAILPYSQMLTRFVAHLQQLDMESNGKRVRRDGSRAPYPTGPIVWGEPGTNGQHAFYQLIHQSKTVVPCEFIAFRRSQLGLDLETEGTCSQQKLLSNVLAQARALAEGRRHTNPNRHFPGNRPSSILIADQLTPRTLGALLAYYEAKVAFQGFIWNINSFDQEGVKLGKGLAGDFLALFKASKQSLSPKGDPTGLAMMKAARLA